MKARLIFTILLIFAAVFSFSAWRSPATVTAASINHRVCEFYYGSFTTTATQRILNTLPEMLVANTRGGSYDYYCPVATLQNAGIKVFSYISIGKLEEYKWSSSSPPNDYATVMAEIRAVAAEGSYGVFLDEAVENADKVGSYSWAGHTVRDVTNLAHSLGLKVIFGNGGYYFNSNCWDVADYILSDEWYGENGTYRSPQRGETLHPERCIVIGYDGVSSAAIAAARTNGALSKGFGYAYHTAGLGIMSSWFEDYMARVKQPSSLTPLSVITSSLPDGIVRSAYKQILAATGGIAPYTWSISNGTLPSGLVLAPATGIVSGSSTTAGTSKFTVKVTDSTKATSTRSISITMNTRPKSSTSRSGGGGGSSTPASYTNLSSYIDQNGILTADASAPSIDSRAVIIIPKGTKFFTSNSSLITSVTISKLGNLPAPPSGAGIIGGCYDIQPAGAVFDPGATLTLSYTGLNLGNFDDKCLAIAYWDSQAQKWVKLSDFQRDTVKKTVTARVVHLSTYGIIGYPPSPAAFTTSNLVVAPAKVEAGKDVTVTLNVTNTGDLSGNYSAKLKVGDTIESTQDVTLEGGETQQITFIVKRAQTGTYNLSIGNLNDYFTSLKPAAFEASDLVISPNNIEAGKNILVTFKVANIAEVSGKYTAALQINGTTEATKEVTLAGGESQNVTFRVMRTQPGTYNVTMGNLSGSFVSLKPAAFKISELTINPTSTQKNKPVTIDFKVANTGQVNGIYTAFLKVNGTVRGIKDVTLEGGESQVVSFYIIQDKAGNYSVDTAGLNGSFAVDQFNWLWLLLGMVGAIVIIALSMVGIRAKQQELNI